MGMGEYESVGAAMSEGLSIPKLNVSKLSILRQGFTFSFRCAVTFSDLAQSHKFVPVRRRGRHPVGRCVTALVPGSAPRAGARHRGRQGGEHHLAVHDCRVPREVSGALDSKYCCGLAISK